MQVFDVQPRFDSFRQLMPHRVRNVLLVSSLYDAFVLEEDATLGDKLWDQYFEQRLTMAPAVRRVSTGAEALELMQKEPIDLLLMMTRMSDGDSFEFSARVKKLHRHVPIVLLVTDPSELRRLPPPGERGGIDKVFLWNNDAEILLAIVKCIEDRANVEHDARVGGVRVIILVEDSSGWYSQFLPAVYQVIMELTRTLIAEGLNDLHKQLRMRSRAKVLLAETFEQAMDLFHRFKTSLVGVVTDTEFPRDGEMDPDAGYHLAHAIREEMQDLPIVFQASNKHVNRSRALQYGAQFIDKDSPTHLNEFRFFLTEYMGFGDFVFRMPDGREAARATNVFELLDIVRRIPAESLVWHAQRHHFSHWMAARTELVIADRLRAKHVEDFGSVDGLRRYMIEAIEAVLADKQSDVVTRFSANKVTEFSHFMHLGKGSLGGKGRSIAFLRFLLARSRISDRYPSIQLEVPPAIDIGSGEFSAFVDDNKLRAFALHSSGRDEITGYFLQAPVRGELGSALRSYLGRVTGPLAVRSSSPLEDSHLQPSAGLYATVMTANAADSVDERLEQVVRAIKIVWASTFFPQAGVVRRDGAHGLEHEEMAVVVQQLSGQRHGDYFYPTLSGVARSYNRNPEGRMRADDGIVSIAAGLGRVLEDESVALRFCPRYPDLLPQLEDPLQWLTRGQRRFYALRLRDAPLPSNVNPDASLALLDLSEHDGLPRISSVYDGNSGTLLEAGDGPRVLTFRGVLRHQALPLAELLSDLLATCREALGCEVEIEFSLNLRSNGSRPVLSLLQVRPFVQA